MVGSIYHFRRQLGIVIYKSAFARPPATSHAVLLPLAPRLVPVVLVLFALRAAHAHADAHAALDPRLALHLGQSAERARKRKRLLVAAEEIALLHHLHGHAQLVHHHAHDVVDVVAVGFFGFRVGVPLFRGRAEHGVGLLARQEELGQGHGGGEDELGVRLVDGVDEGDEAAGDVAVAVVHLRHVGDDEGVVVAHELDVVGGARGGPCGSRWSSRG